MLALLRKPKTVVPEQPPVAAPAIAIHPALPKGSETVLVAEDEATIRAFMATILTELGYHVAEAADGAEALRMAQGLLAGQIDLLVTDIVMPRMSGKELVYRMGKLCPETKVVFCSGYPEKLAVHNGMIDPAIPFLQKPVSSAALAYKVRTILDAAKADFDLERMLDDG